MTAPVDIFGAPLDPEEIELAREIDELYDDLDRVAKTNRDPRFKAKWAASIQAHILRLEALQKEYA